MVEVIRRLSLLNEASLAMTTLMDQDELLDRILDLTKEVFGFNACAVLLVDPPTGDLIIRRARGYDPEVVATYRGTPGKGVTGRAFADKEPVVVSDVSVDDTYIPGVKGAVCEVAIPLRLNSEVIGVLDAESQEFRDFSKEDIQLLTAFASHAATAVNNARLHHDLGVRKKELERKLHLQSLVARASEVMLSEQRLGRVLEEILGLANEALSFQTCAVLLLDKETGDLHVQSAIGYGRDVVGLNIPAGQGISAGALETGEPVLVDDVTQDPRYIQGRSDARCEMVAPLSVRGELIGVLDAEATDPGAFSEDDLEIFTIFAGHAAVAIRNAAMREELEEQYAALNRQIERQRLVDRAGEAVRSTLDLDALLQRILELAQQGLNFQTCAVLLLDKETGDLHVQSAIGYGRDVVGLNIPAGQGISAGALETGEPVLVDDVTQDPRYIQGRSDARCEMVAPLRVNGDIIGVLDAEAAEVGFFTEDDVQLLSIFASNVAVAVRNARQFSELQERQQELETRAMELAILNKVGERIAGILNLEELLNEILTLSNGVLPFDQCAVLLKDSEPGLVLKAAFGYRDEVIGVRIPAGGGITGLVMETGKGVIIPDVLQEPRYIQGVSGGRCEMTVPLRIHGEVIGALDAEATEPGAFDQEDLNLFETFGSWVALAVHNARLYEDLERANASLKEHISEIERMNAELTTYSEQISRANTDLESRVKELVTLYEASKAITSSLDLNQTLNAIVAMTKDIIQASSSAIRLLDDESKELQVSFNGTADGGMVEGTTDEGSQLQAPLRIGNRTIGFFELGKIAGGFTDEEKRMLHTLASQAAIAIENARLFESTQQTYYETIRSLAEALEARDAYTRGHSDRVTRYALSIAEKLDLGSEALKIIGHAGLLHDIGKIGISDTILHKTTALSEEDREAIEHHPIFGDTILGPIKFLQMVQSVVKHHHERYDGSGYPDKLQGDDIPLAARIVAVADSYDAMTSDRPYRPAMTRDEACAELTRNKGRQFDPELVDIFIELLQTKFPDRPKGD